MTHHSRWIAFFRLFSLLVAGATVLLGFFVFLDWKTPIDWIDRGLPLFATMSGYSGSCTLFAGLALFGILYVPKASPWQWVFRACSIVIILLAGVNLARLISISDVWTGLTQRSLPDRLPYTRASAMTAAGAYSFALLAASLLLVSVSQRVALMVGQMLAMVVALLALLGMSGYIYVAQTPGALSAFTAMALPTALVGVFMGFALLVSTPEVGLVQVLLRDSVGGRLARRLVPMLLALQMLLEFLRFRQHSSVFYEEPFGMQLLFALSPFAILLIIAYAAQSIDRSEGDRQKALEELSRLNLMLERRVGERTAELARTNLKMVQEIKERTFLEHEMSEIRENLEERLGRMVHDGIAQDLTGITFTLKALEDAFPQESPDRAALREIRMSLIECCRNAKDLARQIYPPELEAEELVGSLEELAAHTEVQHEVRCTFEGEAGIPALDRESAAHLFYIAQEAVKNAVRHGRPKRITIGLRRDGACLALLVEDDGRGFTPGEQGGGVGLRIIRHRARALHGELTLRSAPGEGTRIHLRLQPIQEGESV